MLLTVTPNLCVERTALVSDFRAGAVHRIAPENLTVNAGGKGINAARVAAQLHAEVLATSWVGRNQRAWFENELAREGVAHDLVEVEADTRVCHNIVHGDGGKTEVVEAGNPLTIADGTRMLAKFESLLPRAELVAICGSYPTGVSTPDAFETHLTLLCALARRHKKKVLVDGKGAAFEKLLRSHFLPWAIKPNSDEASTFLKYSVRDEANELRAVRDFLELGIEVVLLSCGRRGAYLGTRERIFRLVPPEIEEVSAVGAGDAFVGAFAAKFLETADLVEAARWGVAAGAASAAQVRSAFCTREEITALVPRVVVREA